MPSPVNFILLDAAKMLGAIDAANTLNKSGQSLFIGKSLQKLSTVSPWLFALDESGEMVNWFWQKGWGESWGVLVSAGISQEDCFHHFRKFLIVKTEEGKELYFRFYDPRVLRIFLPTCDKQQLIEFFGPIDYFLAEDEDKGYAIEFTLQNGILFQQRIKASELFGEPAIATISN